MKNTVQITVLGQQYTVRAEAEPEEVKRVAAFVNEKLAESAHGHGTDTLDQVVLALLNIGGAYLRLSDEIRPSQVAAERLKLLLERLDAALPYPQEG